MNVLVPTYAKSYEINIKTTIEMNHTQITMLGGGGVLTARGL